MAIIKASNQITITEVKKIKEIKEWYLATSYDEGVTDDHTIWNWTTDIQTIDNVNQYLWNYEEVIYSIGESEKSIPIIIGFYSQGVDGKGIADIANYYLVTQNPELPEEANPKLNDAGVPQNESFKDYWFNNVPLLSPENKYLWNYEIITYTDGTEKIMEPAIIGAYGDSGAAAVDFQIYSVNGYEFTDTLSSIELKTVAYQNGEEILENISYQWKYWNAELASEDKYENIVGATQSSLIVNNTDAYAFNGLKCEITYDEVVYSDYVNLTKQNIFYTATIGFFDGSNIFDQTKSYLVAYIKLYKNNNIEETIKTSDYYDGATTVSDDGVITTDVVGEFADNDLMYFIYQDQNNKYNIVLGMYADEQWKVHDTNSKYVYSNSVNTNTTDNVFVISRNDVSKALEIDVIVYEQLINDAQNIIATTQTSVVDINDPIISDKEPVNAAYGQLWLDTSVDPYVLKIYTRKIKEHIFTLGNEYSLDLIPKNDNPDLIKTVQYSDSIDVSSGKIVLNNVTNIDISYNLHNVNNVADVLLGKYICLSNQDDVEGIAEDEELTQTMMYYYIPDSSDIYCDLDAQYSVKVSKVQDIQLNDVYYGEWVYFSQQHGKTIYTSQPQSGYKEGDLWILADNETYGNYGPGSMLKAIIDPTDNTKLIWVDAMSETTSIIKNVRESFTWDETGIQIAKKVTDKNNNTTIPFYVHIDSKRMGFHSVEYDTNNNIKNDVEVVHIGTNSAIVQNATFEGEYGTTFNNEATFNEDINITGTTSANKNIGFTWTIEANGSLSLIAMEVN